VADNLTFTMPYTFAPNTTTYSGWAIGTPPTGYWKDYSSGGLPQLWWEP